MAKSNFETGATGIYIAASKDVSVVAYGHKHNTTDRVYRVEFRNVVVGDISSTMNENEYNEIKGMIFERSKHIGCAKRNTDPFDQLTATICEVALAHAMRSVTAEDLREVWERGHSDGQDVGREEVRDYLRKGLGI